MIKPLSNITFKGKIIDSHAHIGHWYENDDKRPMTYLKKYYPSDIYEHTKSLKDDTVEKVVFSNLDCFTKNRKTDKSFQNEITGNVESLIVNKLHPELLPLISCEPVNGSAKNIRKLLEKYPDKFVGLKFHPNRSELPANAKEYEEYMQVAADYELPCVFHSSVKPIPDELQYSLPEMIYETAKKYKDVPVVMAHLGAGNHERGINTLLQSIDKGDAKLYCDLSWVDLFESDKKDIVHLLKELKKRDALDRVMFGSDAPITAFRTDKTLYKNIVKDIKSAIKNEFGEEGDEIIEKVFYQNADKLFGKGFNN